MKSWALAGIAGAIAVIAACGSDANQVTGTPPLNKNARGTSGGSDTSATGSGTPTSNGPVTGVVITPHALQMVVGNYAELVAAAHDAAGILVIKKATWRSSDPSIVVPGDTGVIFGKAIGVATVYATIDGFTDSSIVVVERSLPTQTPQPVSQFNMTVVALGAIVGTDTSRAERLSGATVKLQRIGGVTGDTLKTPVDAGFATTNANGEAKFTNLAGGSYSIRITPAAGSPYQETTSGIFPPRLNDITVNVTLRRP